MIGKLVPLPGGRYVGCADLPAGINAVKESLQGFTAMNRLRKVRNNLLPHAVVNMSADATVGHNLDVALRFRDEYQQAGFPQGVVQVALKELAAREVTCTPVFYGSGDNVSQDRRKS